VIRYDAVVVGGGPAGSSCARDLVRAGAAVLVLDRAVFPRDKCCAGWITPHVVAALDLDLAAYGRGHVVQPITGFATSVVGGREIATTYDRPISHAIRRCEFDHYLLDRSGAQLRLGAPVRHLERTGTGWVVDGEIETPVLIGAGGHFCPVARTLHPARDAGPVVAAQECEVRMTRSQAERCAIDPELPALYFCPDRRGYGWCVRKGDFLNVGFGRLADGEFPRHVAAFLAFLHRERKVPPDLPAKWPGHAYRLYAQKSRAFVADGVLLVGDAAGLAHPISGEGILTAVESGRLAARALLQANGGSARDALAPYAAMLEARYGKPAAPFRDRWLPPGLVSWLGQRLMAMPWFVRRVLLERWFLHVDLPRLELAGSHVG
jgi:flavin-dependent dehydrogenase